MGWIRRIRRAGWRYAIHLIHRELDSDTIAARRFIGGVNRRERVQSLWRGGGIPAIWHSGRIAQEIIRGNLLDVIDIGWPTKIENYLPGRNTRHFRRNINRSRNNIAISDPNKIGCLTIITGSWAIIRTIDVLRRKQPSTIGDFA